MENHQLPFDHSYWVEPGKLLAGEYPGDRNRAKAKRKLKGLVDCGIRHIVNLQEEDERNYFGLKFVPYISYLETIAADSGITATMIRMPIRDLDVPTREAMCVILDEIDGSIARGLPVYVHCWGGKGRTGTVIGCWLARHGVATGEAVFDKLAELRRHNPDRYTRVPQTREQIEMVREWRRGE